MSQNSKKEFVFYLELPANVYWRFMADYLTDFNNLCEATTETIFQVRLLEQKL